MQQRSRRLGNFPCEDAPISVPACDGRMVGRDSKRSDAPRLDSLESQRLLLAALLVPIYLLIRDQ